MSEYARQFWWYVATIPVFGLVLMVVGDGSMRAIGMMGMLWPLSLPARALFATRKSANLFVKKTEAEVREDGVYFKPETGQGLRLARTSVHDVFMRKEWVIFRTRKFQFIPVPRNAFDEADLAKITAWVDEE